MSLVQPFCYYEETLTAFSIEQAILTYPFTVSHEHLDGAAVACNLRTQGLRSAIVKQAPTNMLSIYKTDTNSHRRLQSQVTITEGILNSRLKKGKWLNGDLIVFCLLWYVHEGIICVFKLHPGGLTLSILYRITRKQVEEEASSSPTLAPFAFYDDNMYTAWITCSQTKVKQVQHLFDRTFVLIPVCDQGHWSPINTDDGTNSKKRGTCVVCGQLTTWFCRSCMNFCCMERFPGTSTSTITEGIEVLKPDKLVAFVPNENHSDGGYCWKRTCSSVFHDKSLDQYFIKGGDSSKFLSSSMSGNSSARSALREIDLKVKNPSDRRQTM